MEAIRVVLVFCILAISVSCVRVFDGFPLKPCKSNSTCSCTNVDGYYDLHPIANNNNTPHFTNVIGTQGAFIYSYNPCYGFDEGDCTNAAVCQIDLQTGQYYALGYANSMVSVSDSEYGLIFQYTAQTDRNRTAEIILQCDPSKEGELKFQSENPPLYYYFNLYSKYACAQKPSKPTSGSTRPPTPAHHIHSDPKPGHHSRPSFRPTPPRPGRHSRPPRPTQHHGHHAKPTSDPNTPAPLKIFGWPVVTILLLGILIMVTILCGLIIFGICLFSSKFSSSKTPGHKAELGQNVNSNYTSNSDKEFLKNDF